MFKDINSAPNNSWDLISDHRHLHHQHHDAAKGVEDSHQIEDKIYASDEFRMYEYKIKRCPRTRSHDWTECPYAHRGEKAQRRDPRRFRYNAIVCAAFRDTGGSCPKGDACEYAHGVFEYWLHPAKYRTRACIAGKYCQRKVCFFAHSPDQLRPETKYNNKHHHSQFEYRPTARKAPVPDSPQVDDDIGGDCSETPPAGLALVTVTPDSTARKSKGRPVGNGDEEIGGISDHVLKNMRGLSAGGSRETTDDAIIRVNYDSNGGYGHQKVGIGLDALSGDEELQRLGWIS